MLSRNDSVLLNASLMLVHFLRAKRSVKSSKLAFTLTYIVIYYVLFYTDKHI